MQHDHAREFDVFIRNLIQRHDSRHFDAAVRVCRCIKDFARIKVGGSHDPQTRFALVEACSMVRRHIEAEPVNGSGREHVPQCIFVMGNRAINISTQRNIARLLLPQALVFLPDTADETRV